MDSEQMSKETDVTETAFEIPLTTDHEAPRSSFLTGWELYRVAIGLSFSYFLVLLNASIIVTSIPRITKEFNSGGDIGWYGSAYLLANCVLQPLSGKIYTFHSLKYTFLVFLFIFELGSLICGAATSSNMLIVGRAFAGSGASGILNGALTILSACAPLEKRPYLVGGAISFGAIGQVMGPLVGGLLTQHSTWRWSFYLNLPLGGATAVLILLTRIPDQRIKAVKTTWKKTVLELDLVGFALFAPVITILLLALNWGGRKDAWNSATTIGLICGAFVTLCAFLVWEYHKGDDAMVPFRLFRRRITVSCYLTGFFQAGALADMTYYLPLWFQSARRATAAMSGVYVLPTIGCQILLSGITAVLVSKIGWILPLLITGSSMLSIGLALAGTLTPSSEAAKWAGYQILTGAGRGIVAQIPVIVVQAVLSGDEIAIGASLLAFTQFMGGAVFLSAATALFNSGINSSLENFAPEVNATAIIDAGITELASSLSASDSRDVVAAYSKAITQTFYLASAAAVITVFTSLGIGWIDINELKTINEVKAEPTSRPGVSDDLRP